MPQTVAFTKGQGTGNDFVIIPDPDGALALSDAQVAALRAAGAIPVAVATVPSMPACSMACVADWVMSACSDNPSSLPKGRCAQPTIDTPMSVSLICAVQYWVDVQCWHGTKPHRPRTVAQLH